MAGSVPRNFKLLDELDDAEKAKNDPGISLGLSRSDDVMLMDWQASIFCGAGGGEPRLWSLALRADERYPAAPPSIRFISKVALGEVVDASGRVNPAKVPYLASWNPSKTMYGALQEIRNLIARASRAQPPEGANF